MPPLLNETKVTALSIIICTYNRADLLAYCLDSLLAQNADPKAFEVIIINNNSTDETQSVVDRYTEPHFRGFIETKQGLSHARNRGAAEAQSPWLLYLDDDVLLEPDLVDRALQWCERDDIVSFGGSFGPWYHYGKPQWYRDEYASMNLKHAKPTILKNHEFLFGCVFALRKSSLHSVGGFDPLLGMRGGLIGYGEETEVQRLMKEQGGRIAYDPNMVVRHVVNPERLDVMWFLQAGWALGRDAVHAGKSRHNALGLSGVAIIALGLLVFLGVKNGLKLAFMRSYHIENWMVDTLRKFMKRCAILYFNLLPSKEMLDAERNAQSSQ